MSSNRADFEDRTAIVTGGTRGLGLAITKRLLDLGCNVAICGRSAPETPIQAGGREALFVSCDVRDPQQVSDFVKTVANAFGNIDFLVNNAGGSPESDAATASPRFAQAIINLNLLAPLYLSQAAYPHLEKRRGSIVNIASVSGQRASPGTAVYGAAKAGLLGLSRSLAQEWGPAIRVNSIVVGLVETETTEQTYGASASQAKIAASLPLKRLGTGEDVARAVIFLLSEDASYISGASLEVHGGGERPLFLEIVKADATESA
ncbi:SDR family oxidoreductase [Henriciella litoralis]|uniref:SDR family oxidoreductase n=1 Tax=Henriciella litoralis TaxID=568102 RepID=UPI000A038D8D|nr:SDR family oxidoreductase [Henriciella litoralis]